MVCQTIEASLRNVMQRRLKSTQGVDVAYEFPYYPSTLSPWITIQYRSDFDQADDLAKIIMAELEHLRAHGPTAHDLDSALENQKSGDEFGRMKMNIGWPF